MVTTEQTKPLRETAGAFLFPQESAMNRDDRQIAGWRKWRLGFGAGEDKPIERDEPEQPEECTCKRESCGCGCSVTVVDVDRLDQQ